MPIPCLRRAAAVLAAGLLLAACEDKPLVERPNSYHSDVRSVFTAARGAGKILLDVQGAESVGSPEAVKAAALAAMQGRPGGLNPDYTLEAGAAGQAERYVRLIFNPPAGITGQAICRGEGAGENGGELTRIALGFCWNERPLATLRGSAPRLTGPEDRYFKELLEMAARDLYPATERD
jgi:hypothetical protein